MGHQYHHSSLQPIFFGGNLQHGNKKKAFFPKGHIDKSVVCCVLMNVNDTIIQLLLYCLR